MHNWKYLYKGIWGFFLLSVYGFTMLFLCIGERNRVDIDSTWATWYPVIGVICQGCFWKEDKGKPHCLKQAGVTHLPQENMELASQLRRLESSFSVFAEESNPNQLLAHLGRMAVEFHHLSSKVQKNEQRTSLLQVRRQGSWHHLGLCFGCYVN